MKDNTVKLSGHAKDRFIERFFAEEADLDDAVRRRLTMRSKSVFTSLRVRKAALSRKSAIAQPKPAEGRKVVSAASRVLPPTPAPSAPVVPQPAAPPAAEPAPEAAFDVYGIGLVPVFQREGAAGLLAKLAGVAQVDHLRAMAKAQQIVLPQDLRLGEATAETVRAGIVEAVAKRIKDRRAAAG